MSEALFSFQELQEANPVALAALETLSASDGISLSYRRCSPVAPDAVILFYHGGGAHSGAGYQYLGTGLQTQFNLAVFMPDLRGHGASGGPRGDAPHPRQVWADITTLIKHIRAEFPHLPLFLGGHSSGAGLILNYSGQPGHEPVEGYLFLSPEFGFRANTGRPDLIRPFAKVDVATFIANAMSGGLLCGHSRAVRFNYPAEVLASDPGMVAYNTVNMANAITSSAPQQQFAALDRSFGLWIGADDEIISPDSLLYLSDLAAAVRRVSEVSVIPGVKHLSILVKAHESMGPWIKSQVQRMKN